MEKIWADLTPEGEKNSGLNGGLSPKALSIIAEDLTPINVR
jgi:hypothetical protein